MDVLKTTATSITHLVPPGSVEWHVQAVFDGCPTTRSIKSHFNVLPAQTCVTEAPVLSAPADGAANLDSPVHFDWNPVSNAAGYLVVYPPLGLWPSLGELSADYRTVFSQRRHVDLCRVHGALCRSVNR